ARKRIARSRGFPGRPRRNLRNNPAFPEVTDGAVSKRATAARWPTVSDRRRDRDDAHLPRRPGSSPLRGVPPPEDGGGTRRARQVLSRLRGGREATRRRAHPRERDLAREPGLGA